MKWKLICGLPWLLLLGWILSIDLDAAEPALIVILTAILSFAAAPISFAVLGIITVVETGFAVTIIPAFGEFSMSTAIIWWVAACGLFYLQWFSLVPKCVAAIRRLRSL